MPRLRRQLPFHLTSFRRQVPFQVPMSSEHLPLQLPNSTKSPFKCMQHVLTRCPLIPKMHSHAQQETGALCQLAIMRLLADSQAANSSLLFQCMITQAVLKARLQPEHCKSCQMTKSLDMPAASRSNRWCFPTTTTVLHCQVTGLLTANRAGEGLQDSTALDMGAAMGSNLSMMLSALV